nr:MAG TPA: Middle operon regulator, TRANSCRIPTION.2A [Caudoviricetes sp.]
MSKPRGISYKKRVADINRIYDRYARSGLSNRAIYLRYIYPVYGISERTFYNIMNATAEGDKTVVSSDMPSLFDIEYDDSEETQR